MKKLKQLWAILGMVKKFFPRIVREIKDVKTVIDDIKYEWFLNFPPKETYIELEEEVPWDETKMKARSKGASSMLRETMKGYNPVPEDEDMEPEYTPPPIGVPDGRSYFKKKEGE